MPNQLHKKNNWKTKLVWSLHYLFSLLPFGVLYAISDFLYLLTYYVIRYRKKVVRQNLEHSFPNKTKEEIRTIEKKFYHFFCDSIVETNKTFSFSPQSITKRITMSGVEEMEKELEVKDFCFFMPGHYGNWEWMATLPLSAKNKNIYFGTGYQPLNNDMYDEIFLNLRGRFGMNGIASKKLLRTIIAMKKEEKKGIIAFIADQSPTKEGSRCWTNFLNQDTAFFTGAENIGRKQNAAFYFTHVTRPKRGYYHYHFEKIEADVNNQNEVTIAYARMLEKMIMREPALWLWTHRRWKRNRAAYGDE